MNSKSKMKNEKVRGRPIFFLLHFSLSILFVGQASFGADRIIRARDMAVAPGQTNRLFIALESLGDESALGFSLAFNTNQLIFVQAVGGTDSTNAGATVQVNTNQLGAGRVGLAIGLDIFSGATYAAGTNVIAEIIFSPVVGVTSVTSAIAFTNQPIVPEVSDANANALPVSFAGANVSIQMPCLYSLNTNAAWVAASGGARSVSLFAGASCPWTVVNTNTWVAIISATNGTGASSVNYSIVANTGSVSRAAIMLIAGQSFTVTEQGVACTYSLNTNTASFGAEGGSSSVSLATVSDCAWSVLNTNSWVAIISATHGVGGTTVNFSVTNNLNPASRSGTLVVAGQNFSVTQTGVICTYTLLPSNRVHSYPAVTNSLSLTANDPCPWSVTNTNTWLTILSGSNGVGNGTVVYSTTANATSSDRNGSLVIGGEVFVLTQHGLGCSYSMSPNKRSHGFGAASNFFTVNASAGCSWLVLNTNSWLTITNGSSGAIGSGIGNATVGYTVSANPFQTERVGVLSVEGATLIITQSATTCTYTLSPTNRAHSAAASNATVSVSAGAACTWTAATTNDWITITSNPSGTGNGSFGYSIPANLNAASRTGAVMIASKIFMLTQPGFTGGFSFQPVGVGVGGAVTLSAVGGPSGVWELQSSSNLTTWSKLASLTNSTGRVDYVVPNVGGGQRFYRAMLP